MSNLYTNPLKLREIILNTRKPIVLKSFQHNWTCFDGGLEEWCKIYDLSDKVANFERISKLDSWEPQWERKRQLVPMTAIDFLTKHSKDCDYWSGLNYKRRNELPHECTKGIDFTSFGFTQAGEDCTMWLSSKGANTPCHYDTYGCNIVVQVYGRKSWLLFPPKSSLTTTRIPYEESSIYCLENFYAPNIEMKSTFDKCKEQAYYVVLEPNDVLIVPKHWWHYVEALETSLSVNTWIPIEQDVDEQLEECIVKYLIESFVKDTSSATRKYIMNPNQLTAIASNEELFSILNVLLNQTSMHSSAVKKLTNHYKYQYLSEETVDKLLKEFKNINEVTLMPSHEFNNLLKRNSLRFSKISANKNEDVTLNSLQEILINSICSPHIVKCIKYEFCKRFRKET